MNRLKNVSMEIIEYSHSSPFDPAYQRTAGGNRLPPLRCYRRVLVAADAGHYAMSTLLPSSTVVPSDRYAVQQDDVDNIAIPADLEPKRHRGCTAMNRFCR